MKPGSLTFRGLTVASAVLFGLLSLSAAAQPKAGAVRNPLGVRIFSYGAYQDDAWTQLPELGIHYIFLAVPSPDEADAVQKKLEACRLKVAVMRGNAELTGPEALKTLETQLATCRKMGVHYMFFSPKHPGQTKEQAYDLLRKLGDLARKYDVIVSLETHPDLGTNGDEHVATMKAVNHPNIRVNFDTGNITYYNKDRDAVTELKKVLPYLGTVEIKDHNGRYMTWNFPPLGKGIVKIPAVLEVLKQKGYRGPITMEIEGVEGVQRTEQQIKDEIAESVKYMRSLGKFN